LYVLEWRRFKKHGACDCCVFVGVSQWAGSLGPGGFTRCRVPCFPWPCCAVLPKHMAHWHLARCAANCMPLEYASLVACGSWMSMHARFFCHSVPSSLHCRLYGGMPWHRVLGLGAEVMLPPSSGSGETQVQLQHHRELSIFSDDFVTNSSDHHHLSQVLKT
jgi:hypothetical protein